MANFPTYLTLFLLMGACTFNSENSLSDKDGGTDIRDDAGELVNDASQKDAGIVNNDGATPDAALVPDGPLPPPPTCDSTNQDLVLCMTFDGLEATATTVPDLSANNHVATLSTGTIATGQDAEGLQTQSGFISDIITSPSLATAKTIEMWIRPTNLNRPLQGLLEGNDYYFYIYETGRLSCASRGMSDNSLTTSQDSVIVADQWQHVACVMTNSGARLFVNGVEIVNRDSLIDTFANSSPDRHTFGRGSLVFGGGDRLVGKMDTLRVWSTDRSAQICANCETPVTPPQ